MPTKREREYYQMGYRDGMGHEAREQVARREPREPSGMTEGLGQYKSPAKKRKLSAWNKYIRANSKKPRFRYRNGRLNLGKMAVAFRKTPAGKKKKTRKKLRRMGR